METRCCRIVFAAGGAAVAALQQNASSFLLESRMILSIPAVVLQDLCSSPLESNNICFYPRMSPTTSVIIPTGVPQRLFLSLQESHNICLHPAGVSRHLLSSPHESHNICLHPCMSPTTCFYPRWSPTTTVSIRQESRYICFPAHWEFHKLGFHSRGFPAESAVIPSSPPRAALLPLTRRRRERVGV